MFRRPYTTLVSVIALVAAFLCVHVEDAHAQKGDGPLGKRVCPVKPPPGVLSDLVRSKIKELQEKPVFTNDAINVPVYAHILQSSTGSNPIDERMVRRTVRRLNKGFKSAGFVYELVSIETIVNDAWSSISEQEYEAGLPDTIAEAKNVGPRNALNLYFGSLDGLCGFADFPFYENPNEAVFMDHGCSVGGSAENDYDTITHEVGHFMGLLHTFAPEPNGCRSPGDEIADTPAQKESHRACGPYDTCPSKRGLDPTNNFMDYSVDQCNHIFTRRQINVMRNAHTSYRGQ